jgi:hypothetical protein
MSPETRAIRQQNYTKSPDYSIFKTRLTVKQRHPVFFQPGAVLANSVVDI